MNDTLATALINKHRQPCSEQDKWRPPSRADCIREIHIASYSIHLYSLYCLIYEIYCGIYLLIYLIGVYLIYLISILLAFHYNSFLYMDTHTVFPVTFVKRVCLNHSVYFGHFCWVSDDCSCVGLIYGFFTLSHWVTCLLLLLWIYSIIWFQEFHYL